MLLERQRNQDASGWVVMLVPERQENRDGWSAAEVDETVQ
jgi:hypothetical protein